MSGVHVLSQRSRHRGHLASRQAAYYRRGLHRPVHAPESKRAAMLAEIGQLVKESLGTTRPV